VIAFLTRRAIIIKRQYKVGAVILNVTRVDTERIRGVGRATIHSENKVRAAVYFLRAADFYAEADLPEKERGCLNKTARLAPLPRLKIEAVNIPVFEEDEPGTIAFNIRNFGKGAAHRVTVELGGTLKHPVSFELSDPIQPAGRVSSIEISDILPTDIRLRVAISYTDRHGTAFHYHTILEIPFTPIDADIVVDGDTGATILRLKEGAPMPKVRIRGDAGLIKVVIE